MGIKSFLGIPAVYQSFRRAIAGEDLNQVLVQEYIQPDEGNQILDVGCGPASILASLPEGVGYTGFDPSPKYVEAARKRFGDRGRFFEGLAVRSSLAGLGPFDRILAVGVLHHLDDAQADELFHLAFEYLSPGGSFVTLDGAFTEKQNPLARMLLKMDRGEYVRETDAYAVMARKVFPTVDVAVRTDLLRIPYTHVILTARKP